MAAPLPQASAGGTSQLFRMAWPIAAEQLLNMSLLWVDSIIINRYLGTTAFAAVQLSSQIFNMISLALTITATGASIVISHQVGARKETEAGGTASQSIGLNLLLGVGLGCVLFFGAQGLLHALGARGDVQAMGFTFSRVLALFMPAQAFLTVLGAILRAVGDTRSPMLVTMMVNVLNAGINFILVAGTPAVRLGGLTVPALGGGWGLFGSALGTSIARTTGSLLLLLILLRREDLQIQLAAAFRFSRETVLRVARMGVPAALESVSYQASQLVLTSFVAPLGTVAIAARGLTFQAEAFTYVPTVGLASAASILVGQQMGAGQRNRAVATGRNAIKFGLASISALALLLALIPHALASVFTQDPAVLALAASVLRISAAYKPGQCINVVAGGIFRGAGNPEWPTVLTTLGTWLITVPLAFLAVRSGWGLPGVLWAMFADEMVRGCTNLWYFTTPRWRHRRV